MVFHRKDVARHLCGKMRRLRRECETVKLNYLLDYCCAKIVMDDLIVPNVIIMLE